MDAILLTFVCICQEVELKWTPPLEEELKAFLVQKMGFNEDRVTNGIKRLMEAQQKKAQQRMDRWSAG